MRHEGQYPMPASGLSDGPPSKDPILSRLENSIGSLNDAGDQISILANDICGQIPQSAPLPSKVPSGPNPSFAETIELAIELINIASNDIRKDTVRIRERLLR